MSAAFPPDPDATSGETSLTLPLQGPVTLAETTELHATLGAIGTDRDVVLDMAAVTRIDAAGAWAVASLRRRLAEAGRSLRIDGAPDKTLALLASVDEAVPDAVRPAAKPVSMLDRVESVGKTVAGGAMFLVELTGFLGLFLARLARSILHPREFRLTALVHHCQEVGLKAVPIVALMAFLIGVVLAFQGAAQLRQFGAEVFVVDLIAVSILRELGILLTAIIVAGRTASAYTAAIGSMKMREEIDAMRTLGLDPATALFVPRILALLLMLPILGLIADVAGLLGGALMAWTQLGISPAMFRVRLIEGTDVSHVLVGLIKAPVFALIIGIVGCHAGMQVEGNAESLGRMTSQAVVTAIFAVILADAVFSIFFAQVGL